MRGELRAIHKEFAITFVHVTHTQLEALGVADLVVVMDHGEVVQTGTPEELYSFPRNAYVAEFIGGQVVFEGVISEADEEILTIQIPSGEKITVPKNGNYEGQKVGDIAGFSVRRDRISLAPENGPEAGHVAIKAKVEMTEYQGIYVKVQGNTMCGSEFTAYIDDASLMGRTIHDGETLTFSWDQQQNHLLEPGS